jgi:pyroglutamyl-peptidase
MLLLTAFEPFDATAINSSLEALNVWQQSHSSRDVRTAILPVRYEDDVTMLAKVLEAGEPDVILHLGQTTRAYIEVERVAVNLKLTAFAPSPQQPIMHVPILDSAPAAYNSTIPVDELVRAMVSAGLPARDSAHAGTYLCNHILYRSLHRAATQQLQTRVGFLHLPRLSQQAEMLETPIPTQPLEILVQAIEIAVDKLQRVS